MPTRRRMELGLYDARGHRKYLTTAERTAFLTAAEEALREVRTLCGRFCRKFSHSPGLSGRLMSL
jgi:hypothetical protein